MHELPAGRQPTALSPAPSGPRRAVVWRRLDEPGADYCCLGPDGEGWRLEGAAVAALDGRPVRASYVVTCDGAWRTRSVAVSMTDRLVERSLRLDVDERQRWWRDGVELTELAGLLDVDLGITPATNTLPIRRLDLAVGAGRDVTAVWVSVPDLAIERLPQRYTRLGTFRHRYESDAGRFVAELEVDELGLVVSYENGWERVASIG